MTVNLIAAHFLPDRGSDTLTTSQPGKAADWTVPEHGGVLWSSPKHPQCGIMGWRAVASS